MTDRNLALALMQAGRLTMEQVQAAGKLRAPGKRLAHVLVELDWIPRADILLLDAQAFDAKTAQNTAPNVSPSSVFSAVTILSAVEATLPLTTLPLKNGSSEVSLTTISSVAVNQSEEAAPLFVADLGVKTENLLAAPNASAPNASAPNASAPNGVVVNGDDGGEISTFVVPMGLGYGAPPVLEGKDVRLDGENERIEDAAMGMTVRICNEILLNAVKMGASDVHLEPRPNGILPRYRVDGHLRTGNSWPREMLAPIVSRLKVMANLNITETRLSQDGRFRATVGGHRLDFRVSTLPGLHGEKIVLRLLDHSALVTDLTRLGFSPQAHAQFEEMLRRAHGMILVTGPTGSGKSTTLYAALASTLDETKNVVTVEDPVEYELEGVMQCHVHVEIGNTFAARLRSILRQDPDVILVGEIRDGETADIAIRAALTGHLVLSTLHTNSAVASVARLQDMGVAPFLIASSLSGVVAQRLVRLICRKCREPVPHGSHEYELAVAQLKLKPGTVFYRGAGCEACSGTGHRGRVAVMELMNVDKDVRRAIMNRADTDELQAIARKQGMRTIYQDGVDKLQNGLTTADELARVLLGNEEIELN